MPAIFRFILMLVAGIGLKRQPGDKIPKAVWIIITSALAFLLCCVGYSFLRGWSRIEAAQEKLPQISNPSDNQDMEGRPKW